MPTEATTAQLLADADYRDAFAAQLRRQAPALAREAAHRTGELLLDQHTAQVTTNLLRQHVQVFVTAVVDGFRPSVQAQVDSTLAAVDDSQLRAWAQQQASAQVAQALSAPLVVPAATEFTYRIGDGPELTGDVDKARRTWQVVATTEATTGHITAWRAHQRAQLVQDALVAAVHEHALPAARAWATEQAVLWRETNRQAYLDAQDPEPARAQLLEQADTLTEQAEQLRARCGPGPHPRRHPRIAPITLSVTTPTPTSGPAVELDLQTATLTRAPVALPGLTLRYVLDDDHDVPEHSHSGRRTERKVERHPKTGAIVAVTERDLDNPAAPVLRWTVQSDGQGRITGTTATLEPNGASS